MRRIFLDANILIDYSSKSAVAEDAVIAVAIINYCLKRSITMLVSTHSMMVLSYFLSKELGQPYLLNAFMNRALQLFEIITVDRQDIVAATNSFMSDFEDAVQLSCALKGKAYFLVTKNTGDFYGTTIPIIPPDQFFDFI